MEMMARRLRRSAQPGDGYAKDAVEDGEREARQQADLRVGNA